MGESFEDLIARLQAARETDLSKGKIAGVEHRLKTVEDVLKTTLEKLRDKFDR